MPQVQYVYYKDKPGRYADKVVDIRGNIEYAENCRKFAEGYLVKGIDIEYVQETWIRIDKLVFDYELQKEVHLAEKPLSYGIVKIDEDGLLEKGYYTANPYKNCSVRIDGKLIQCIDWQILPDDKYHENLSEGIYYPLKGLNKQDVEQLAAKRFLVNFDKHGYNAEDNKAKFNAQIELYNNSPIKVDKDLQQVAKYLGDLSIGCEFETINGTMPEHILNKYGVIICKDGSIRDGANYPPEYTTVPLTKAKGLQVLRDLPKEIAKRSDINVCCSLHNHIGGFTIDRVMFVSLYRLCTKIQDDVFKMFPAYKVNWEYVKEKNYCEKLPTIVATFGKKNYNRYINNSYHDIYRFLSGGVAFGEAYNRTKKTNPWGKNKWDIRTRYHWVNFINPLFGKRDTIEFRVHTPTLNSDKVLNWVFMSSAIIRFAETKILDCIGAKPITFTDVLNWYGDYFKTEEAKQFSQNLINYYNNRVEYFVADAARGDNLSPKELIDDQDFKFNTTIIK
jgi:hypothetical protein